MRRFKPTLWLSFGLVSLTLALSLTAYLLGLIPDGQRAELKARAKVAEALAVQLAGAVNRNDSQSLLDTISSVTKRNSDVLSIAVLNADDDILVDSGDHKTHWIPITNNRSTPVSVAVPLLGADGPQGVIQIAFKPAASGKYFLGFPVKVLMLLAFLAASGFIGYFFILRRTLRELDPGRVIPERVQKSFDTLSEGVIILDERQRILLTNASFRKLFGEAQAPALGSKINTLSWRMVDGSAQAGGYPWHKAMKENREMREDFLSLRTPDGGIHNFNVNATVINNEKGRRIGAIVTLQDMTTLNQSVEALEKSERHLLESQEELSRQKQELEFLLTCDPLTGCLNRRTLLQKLDSQIEDSRETGLGTALLMADIDHLTALNDTFGPAVGDTLLTVVANILKTTAHDGAIVARYGGDEFCIVLSGLDTDSLSALAGNIASQLKSETAALLSQSRAATLSFGIAQMPRSRCSAQELLTRARQALNNAKANGRNRTAIWSDTMTLAPETTVFPDAFDTANHPSDTEAPASHTVAALAEQARGIGKMLGEDELVQAAAAATNKAFFERVDQGLARAEFQSKEHAVVQLSISSWDYLTEALGEKIAERLMRAVKRNISSVLREQDGLLIQPDGGTLLIHLAEMDQRDDAQWAIKRIFEVLRQPIKLGQDEHFIACNIGLASFPGNGRDAETLVRNAGIALRRAEKENKVEGVKTYDAEMTQNSRKRLIAESGIREALRKDDFELFFQPIVCAQTGSLSGAEALLRCTNNKLSDLRIDQIIEIAEQSSLIVEIDGWVVRAALKQMQIWCELGLELPRVSINISAQQFTNISFMDDVYELIKNVPFSPSRIQIEVTETGEMFDTQSAAPQLKRLQQLGVMIALDDFGTGQASLTYLQKLHPDVVKIDRSFITGVNTNHANATLVSATTVMAHCLGLKVVAEGVEDEEQLEFLRETECDEIQGYLISRPMPADVMTDWLELFVKNKGVVPYLQKSAEIVTPPAEHSAADAA